MEIATTWHKPSSFLPRHRNSLPDRFWLWMAAWACRWPGKSPSSPTVEKRPFQGRVTNEAKMGFSPLCSTRESVARPLEICQLLTFCCIVATFAGSTGPRFSAEFMKPVFLTLLLLCASLSCAQTRLEDGGHEIQLWTGGGHSVSGGGLNARGLNAGLRYGWGFSR